jgi:hypothetical protein
MRGYLRVLAPNCFACYIMKRIEDQPHAPPY